jgi:tetratricopeptide (TPR) repeat protein
LSEALLAAGQAAEKSPNFGFAWVRVAELEFSFGRTSKALTALEKGLQLSPRNAQALALKGFLLSARNQIAAALGQFDQAIAIDGALGNAWLGRGLCKIRQGKAEAGRQDIQTATVLEPQRAVLRSYLGKAWSNEKDNTRARQELELAKRLDPNDPTAWLYSALINQQQNRINEAIHDLEKSQELNENRRLYRSRMLLDQDRAVRGANLAGIYQDAGMFEVSVREAGRAVSSDYANYSAHLFLANSYNALRDPRQITLRYETPWLSEFLVANLLAPVGAGTLSQYISQNEYSRLFERDRIGLSSSTEYLSGGDWVQSASQFGTVGGASYALDTLYRSETGQRPNNDLEQVTFSAKLKQQITTQDSVYLQTIFYNSESGDAAQYYDPGRSTQLRLRVKETQEPMLLGGYHHEWVPGIHTLLLAGRLEDTFRWTDPAQSVLYLFKNNLGQVNLARSSPAALEYRTEFEAYTAELQQICQQEKHTSVMGARYQVGGFDTQSRLGFATPLAQDLSPDFQRLNFYGYHHWQMAEPLLLTVGLSYDRLKYPSNFRVPPITSREGTDDQVSPKAGIIWTPWKHTAVRASFTRSLGGVSYDQSFRLEPTQVAGFNQAYRSIISESVAGAMASPAFETWGVALDQKCGRGTYLTLESEWLNSEVARVIGAMDVTTTGGFPPVIVYTPSGTRQHLDYREKNLMLTVNQLLGKVWSLGAKYRLSQTELETDFPDIPLAVTPAAHTEQEAILHQVRLHTLFNHASGFFGLFESVWSSQSNLGYTPDLPGDDFWHFNVHLGYRFPRRQAEVRVGVLNLADEDYHLNPLSLYPEYRHSRTLALSCKLYF